MEIHPSDWPEWMREEDAKHQRNYLRRVVGLVLLALFVAWATGAWSQPLANPTRVSELFAQAVKLGGYEAACMARGGCEMPAVVVVKIDSDNVAGQFHWKQPMLVSLNADIHLPGSLEWNGTVVHEFVHYLQWLTGKIGPQTPCEGIVEAEREAYATGAAYFAQFGIVKDYGAQMFMVMMMCLPG